MYNLTTVKHCGGSVMFWGCLVSSVACKPHNGTLPGSCLAVHYICSIRWQKAALLNTEDACHEWTKSFCDCSSH